MFIDGVLDVGNGSLRRPIGTRSSKRTTRPFSGQVDRISEYSPPVDPVLDAALKVNADADLPAIDVSSSQVKYLHLLARSQGARRVLEIGTLGGYRTIWLARALPPDGLLVSLESDEKHLAVARANVERAKFHCKVDLRLGHALESLARLKKEGDGPFDFFFIDADKPNTPA